MNPKFEYTLKNPISISAEGRQITEDKVTVMAPRPKDKWNLSDMESVITQGFFNAQRSTIMNLSEKQKKDLSEQNQREESQEKTKKKAKLEEDIDGTATLILGSATRDDVKTLYNILCDLMCEGNSENPQAKIGSVKFTRPLFDDLDYEDMKALLVRYVYHFLSSKSKLIKELVSS